MAQRRGLLVIVLVAAVLHGVGIARTLLPAQDGLKLIRFARQFQDGPWFEAVRGADVHPLYPALIAAAEPIVSAVHGSGPDAWRFSAQLVSVLASLLLLFPVYLLTESLFDRRVAFIGTGVLALLPRIAEVGRETLADSVGLCATFTALYLAARAISTMGRVSAVAAGVFAGLGYLARPEAILVPAVFGLAWLVHRLGPDRHARKHRTAWVCLLLMLAPPALAIGGYAAVKGELTEKLALRRAVGLGPQSIVHRSVPQQVPRGLDDPRWDFSAKEESGQVEIRGAKEAVTRIVARWWDGLSWFFAVMTAWGLVRGTNVRRVIHAHGAASHQVATTAGIVLGSFALVHTLALVRHSTASGYLSTRHVLPLVVASIPWAAAGTYICCHRTGELLKLASRTARIARRLAATFTLLLSVLVQTNPNHMQHLSRWGHWAAGQWLALHAAPDEEVLDTRGWARFVSGRPGYDYWHVRQALTDSKLSYITVGLDELEASSARGKTLRTLLAYAAEPLAEFPASPTDPTPAVRIYRFHRPASWEGILR